MAVQPLSPATDRRLGEPLPHQLPNRTRAHLRTINLWYSDHAARILYAVLAAVSSCYSPFEGRLLTRYSPVRHWSESRSSLLRSTWMCYARRQRSSWARIKLLKKVCPKRTPQSPFICSLLLCLSCTTCVLIFFELTRFFTNSFLALYLFIVVQFSRTDSSLSRNLSLTACILYHIIQRLSRPFCKVFRVFFAASFDCSLVFHCSLVKPSRMRPYYSITSSSFCQVLLRNFFRFFVVLQ